MSLNSAAILDVSFGYLMNAEDMKMNAYSGFTLLVLTNGVWAAPGASVDEKTTRKLLRAQASLVGFIATNTWDSYVKGIFDAADKFAANLQHDTSEAGAEFRAIRDMDTVDAIEAVRRLYETLNVVTGGHIRDWSKAPGFEPLDREAVKAAAKAAAKAKARDAELAALATFRARNSTDSATISDMAPAAPAAPADPVAALAALLGTMKEGDLLRAMEAVNERLTFLAAAKAKPATVAPVLADDVVPAPKSGQAAIAARVAEAAAA